MESALIELTESAIREHRLDIRACGPSFFPHDAVGSSSEKDHPGVPLILLPKGLSVPVRTDIPTDNRSGRIRWFFRERGWVRNFIQNHLRPGSYLSASAF